MTKQEAEAIRHSFDAAVRVWAAENGMEFRGANLTYSPHDDHVSMSCKMSKAGGVSREAADYLQTACGAETIDVIENGKRSQMTLEGPRKEWLGKQVTWRGEQIKLIGMRPRSRKYPYIYEVITTGKRFKMTRDSLMLAYGGGGGC